MRIRPRLLLPVLLAVLLLAAAATARAEPPWSLEQLYSKPWPFGSGFRHVALSDDGAHLACAWDKEAESIYDLWVYDVAADEWTQYTDLWPARETHRRREFSRELEQAREEWEEKQQADDNGEEGAAAENDAGEDTTEFDETERIEEFEKELAKERDKFAGVSQVLFARGGHEVLYIFEGGLYSLDLDMAEPAPRERVRHEQGVGGLKRIDDRDELLLVSDADVLLWHPASGQLTQLTTGGWSDLDNASLFAMTSDLRYLATVRRDYRSVRKQQMPDLLAEDPHTTSHYHVRPQDTPEEVQLLLIDLAAPDPWTIEVELPDEGPFFHVENLKWSPLGDCRLLVCTISGDTLRYSAWLVTPPGEDEDEATVELLYREEDERWINWRRTRVDWAHGGSLLLQSEKDGLASVYRLEPRPEPAQSEMPDAPEDTATDDEIDSADEAPDLGSHQPVPLYTGEHEIIGMRPLRHSPHVLLALSHPDPASRGIALLELPSGRNRMPFGGPGRRSWQAVSEDESLLAYSSANETRMSRLMLYPLAEFIPVAFDSVPRSVEKRVILSREPAEWGAWAWRWNQRFITVEGEGGDIPVKLWLPPDWSPDGRYPLLVWAHGAGYAQTVTREPGFYKLFHPWVAEQRGWLVAEVDYRGSEGYGRDWRVDVWGRLGHPETDDLVAVKHHLVEQYGADSERTAIWGWSYGGFLTLMALGLAPGEFPVGIAVAPVTRWENYYHYYSTCRLGHPDDNPDEYELSSAEECLGSISDDLLIVHGLRDDNTLFQSVAQYIEKGHELGVHVELKLFPGDDHGIGNEQHYIRIYEAILEYCDEHWPPAGG